MSKFLVGVDEVGRGPLAGPVMVCAACVPVDFDWTQVPGVGDSKQVSPKRRLAVHQLAKRLKTKKIIDYAVVAVSAARIDRIGIVPAITEALTKALTAVTARQDRLKSSDFSVKLDGGLRAPEKFTTQETIIKGDMKEPVIGLASIIAKVTRDTYMERLAQSSEYSLYDFATHKGYGTKQHRAVIASAGLSPQHRVTFCKNIMKNKVLTAIPVKSAK